MAYIGSRGLNVAQNALARWLGTQRQAKGMFGQAEQPLQESVQMFQPGGGYGKGQATLLRGEARRAKAEALSSQVATGMSSGSLATGTGLRVERDLAQGLAGVEDVRTQFLAQALESLSGLRGQRSQTLAATQDPISVPYMSYLGGAESRASQEAMQRRQIEASVATQQMQIQAQKDAAAKAQAKSGASFTTPISANQYYR